MFSCNISCVIRSCFYSVVAVSRSHGIRHKGNGVRKKMCCTKI